MNLVTLIGRLTKDNEIQETQNDTAFLDFTLAVQRHYKDKRTGEYPADFIRCRAWGKTAEILDRYTSKGSQVGVEGELRTYSYEDQQGNRRYGWQVNVNSLDLLDSRSERQQQPRQQAPQQQAQGAGIDMTEPADFSDEDLPF